MTHEDVTKMLEKADNQKMVIDVAVEHVKMAKGLVDDGLMTPNDITLVYELTLAMISDAKKEYEQAQKQTSACKIIPFPVGGRH